MKMINVLLFIFFFLVASNINHRVEGMERALVEDLKLEIQLKQISKQPIKTIHTIFGDIVDCVYIEKQPAFNHPLLQNHKLQRKPNFQNIRRTNSSAKPIGFGLEKNQCPIGTVPIQRITKEDLRRERSLFNNHSLTQAQPGSHVAEVTYGPFRFRRLYGVNGTTSVYNPEVSDDQSSESHIWVQNGQGDDTNKIAIGWHVFPQLYGDYKTHIYASWTSDNFKRTGCYNVKCPGFVQVNRQHYLGESVPITSYPGHESTLVNLEVSITQDSITKHWWVISNNNYIGYFPAVLFTNMNEADQVGWGGVTKTLAGHLSPPMGSGHYPRGDKVVSCYFANMSYMDETRKFYGPPTGETRVFRDNYCFSAEYYGFKEPDFGFYCEFGGRGGFCGN